MERVNSDTGFALDQRKQELLEARFLGRSGSESNMSAASSIGGHGTSSDKDNDSVLSTQDITERSNNKKGKKRKADEQKKSNPTTKKIQQYVIDSPAKHSRNSQNYLHASQSSQQNHHGPSSIDYFMHRPSSKPVPKENKETQTDMNYRHVEELEAKSSAHLNDESKYNETFRRNTLLAHQLTQTNKLAVQNKKQSEASAKFIQDLLMQNAKIEKEEARQKAMDGRLRLGQFRRRVTGYHESWENGYAFSKIALKKENISKEKINIDLEKNTISKLKKERIQKEKIDIESTKKTLKRKQPNLNRNKGVNDENKGNQKADVKENFTPQEFHERDEILKQRLISVKKDEQDLQFELDRLERERSLHIRELKRIANEDNSQFNHHPVLHKRYLLLTMLGKGGFSEVYKGFDLEVLRYVAVKIHHLNREWNEQKKMDYARHANRESEIHRTVNHRRIVGLYDRFEVDINTFCTVLEFCEGNDLDFYLKQHKVMNEKEGRTIIMQVVSALYYLNSLERPVIHYDLKPGNILLCNGTVCGDIKITDFGLSKRLDAGQGPDEGMDLTSQGAGTYWYLPPECFVRMENGHPPKIDNKVDVWSVGVIFYQCLFGKKPFGHNLSQEAILKDDTILKATSVLFPNRPAISAEAKSFIKACLSYDKEQRADVFQLYRHPYLQPNVTKRQQTISSANNTTSHQHNGSYMFPSSH